MCGQPGILPERSDRQHGMAGKIHGHSRARWWPTRAGDHDRGEGTTTRATRVLKRFDAKGGDAKDEQLLTLAKVDSIKLQKDAGASVRDYQGPHPVVVKGHVISAQGNAVTSLNLETRQARIGACCSTVSPPAGTPTCSMRWRRWGTAKLFISAAPMATCCALMRRTAGWFSNYATGQKVCDAAHSGERERLCDQHADGLLICIKTGDKAADGWYAWGGNAAHNKE